jgi:LPS sulfotransferase NodH
MALQWQRQSKIMNIIVIGQQRTGSNLLCYALSFFKEFRNINEFYSVDRNNFIYNLFFSQEERDLFFKNYKTKNWRELLDKIHADPRSSYDYLNTILGDKNKIIKLLEHQFEINSKLYTLLEEDCKFIILDRTNDLEQYVSLKIAEDNDVWWKENTDNFQITLELNDYNNFKKQKKEFYNKLECKLDNKTFIKLNYENDLQNGITDNLLDKLSNFLGIQVGQDKDRNIIEKQNTIECYKKIKNYQEIKDLI